MRGGGEDRGQVFEGRIEGELARPRGGIALSPRHFYVFKPVNKFWRSPIVATRPLPSKYALVICWREPLTFNVKLNRERARGRLVPRARLRGVPLNSSRGRITLRIESKRVRSRCYGTGEDESDSLRLRIVGKIGESRLLPPFSCSFVIRKRTIQFYLFDFFPRTR